MATLTIELNDATRNPLDDIVDVDVRSNSTGALVFRVKGVSGKRKLRVPRIIAGQPYTLRVLPMRHRIVQQFASVPNGRDAGLVSVYCPVDPRRVVAPLFPGYASLDPALCRVLEVSTLEQEAGPQPAARTPRAASPGERLFIALDDTQKAGLLNVFAKMRNTLMGGKPTWDFVTDLYRVRGDRLFANVTIDFRDRVKNEVAGGTFRSVSGTLHKAPQGFVPADSFKTQDQYGNLQVTFFSSEDTPLRFRVDADIDDAAGIEHAFQVIGHNLTGEATHPYDIHEILTFYQRIDVGYGLPV